MPWAREPKPFSTETFLNCELYKTQPISPADVAYCWEKSRMLTASVSSYKLVFVRSELYNLYYFSHLPSIVKPSNCKLRPFFFFFLIWIALGVRMLFCPLPFLKTVQIKVHFVKEFYYLFNNFLKGSTIASWDYIHGKSFPSWANKEHTQVMLHNINSSGHL